MCQLFFFHFQGEIFVADCGGRVGLDFLIKVKLTKSEVLERLDYLIV